MIHGASNPYIVPDTFCAYFFISSAFRTAPSDARISEAPTATVMESGAAVPAHSKQQGQKSERHRQSHEHCRRRMSNAQHAVEPGPQRLE